MAQKVFTDESLSTLVSEIKSYTDTSSAERATKGHGIYYGTCATAAATAAKVVTLTDATGFSLTTGAVVIVKFTYANSASSPTLNVNSTGAKAIMRYGTTAASTTAATNGWSAGAVQILVYDGTNWVRDYWNNTTYANYSLGQGYGTCSTAEATTAKVVSLSSYALSTGGIVSVKFTYAVPASATMNINSKGAKNIYYRGASITANVIKAGDIATFIYDGTQYHLLSIDRWQNDINALQTAVDGKAASSHTHTKSQITDFPTSLKNPNALTIQGNGTTLTNGTYDGSAAKTVNITPSAIGAAASSHTHDDRYYTETEIDTKLSGKANSSHGNHVPTTQTASNKVFLRNDNTWATVTPANIGAAASSHTHTVANITDLTATAAELNYMDGVTSNVQTQLDAKQATITGGATTITGSNLTANRALISNGSGKVAVSAVTSTELGYLDGVTSAIQTQLNGKASTAVATTSANGLMSAADKSKVDLFDLDTSDGIIFTVGSGSVTGGYIELNNNDCSVSINGDNAYIGATDTIYITNNGEGGIYLNSEDNVYVNGVEVATIDDLQLLDRFTYDSDIPKLTIDGGASQVICNDDCIELVGASGVYANGKQLDNIYSVSDISNADFWLNEVTRINSSSSNGITWGEDAVFYDDAGDEIVTFPISHRVPLVAGNNVTLEADTDNMVVKANVNYITTGAKSGTTIGTGATIEGILNTGSGSYSHAEGYITTATGSYSHAEGNSTTASASAAHAEGNSTTASGTNSHAEGFNTTASNNNAHAEGSYTTASGINSHAEGIGATASGNYSHAAGYYTTANNYQYVVGKYNASTTAPTSLTDTTAGAGIFIVGVGTSTSAKKNGFRVNPAGKCYSQSTFGTSGADYAEYFEWLDGNPNNEDRRGHFVTLEGDKIRYATFEDDYILGVVSADPSVAGDIHSENWHSMHLKDVFGSNIVEVVDVEETIDENGEIIPAHIERRLVLNPDYDPNVQYISREERPEWAAIGLVGKLVVVDDGTCQVNGYCCPNADGIASSSQERTNYRVMERLDDTHIRIFIR